MPEDRKLQVLYVTPSRFMRTERFVIEALEQRGFNLTVFNGLQRAANRLALPSVPLPDVVVLTDYDHGWDGVDLVKAIRAEARTRALPIVMLSTNCDPYIPDRGSRALIAGANTFHEVPVRVDVIVASINQSVA